MKFAMFHEIPVPRPWDYEATGCDVVFCLMNPYNIAHEDVMQTIELMGKHVISAFS